MERERELQLKMNQRTLVLFVHFYQRTNGLEDAVQPLCHGSSQTPRNHRDCESQLSQKQIRQDISKYHLSRMNGSKHYADVRCLCQMLDCLLQVNKVLHSQFSNNRESVAAVPSGAKRQSLAHHITAKVQLLNGTSFNHSVSLNGFGRCFGFAWVFGLRIEGTRVHTGLDVAQLQNTLANRFPPACAAPNCPVDLYFHAK